jgi:predicted tellurium resistance membrane protein TerC
LLLVVFGILVSIPIIVWGSTLVLKLMARVPLIITLGAALLGYLAAEMMISDVAVTQWVQWYLPDHELRLPALHLHLSLPGLVGAIGVVIAGRWLARKTAGENT